MLGCRPPGKPTAEDIQLKPEQVRDFAVLYKQNCSGCHGRDGQGSAALGLANPIYLAIASDDDDSTRHRSRDSGDAHACLCEKLGRSPDG